MAVDKFTALSATGLLRGLPEPLIRNLAEISGVQRVGKGSTLFREGDRAHFVHALAEGGVSLISEARGENSIVDFLGKGDVILVPPVLLDLPYMVTAKAVADLVVVMIPAAEFRAMAKTQLPLATALNELLATQWRLLVKHLTSTRSRDADSRVIQFIVDAAGATKGPAQIALPGSKRDLASHLGLTPETLSRSFKRLTSLGVKTAGSKIEVENMTRLGNLGAPRQAAVV
jgi:CRP/FNR family transcriptional activator FtrB